MPVERHFMDIFSSKNVQKREAASTTVKGSRNSQRHFLDSIVKQTQRDPAGPINNEKLVVQDQVHRVLDENYICTVKGKPEAATNDGKLAVLAQAQNEQDKNNNCTVKGKPQAATNDGKLAVQDQPQRVEYHYSKSINYEPANVKESVNILNRQSISQIQDILQNCKISIIPREQDVCMDESRDIEPCELGASITPGRHFMDSIVKKTEAAESSSHAREEESEDSAQCTTTKQLQEAGINTVKQMAMKQGTQQGGRTPVQRKFGNGLTSEVCKDKGTERRKNQGTRNKEVSKKQETENSNCSSQINGEIPVERCLSNCIQAPNMNRSEANAEDVLDSSLKSELEENSEAQPPKKKRKVEGRLASRSGPKILSKTHQGHSKKSELQRENSASRPSNVKQKIGSDSIRNHPNKRSKVNENKVDDSDQSHSEKKNSMSQPPTKKQKVEGQHKITAYFKFNKTGPNGLEMSTITLLCDCSRCIEFDNFSLSLLFVACQGITVAITARRNRL